MCHPTQVPVCGSGNGGGGDDAGDGGGGGSSDNSSNILEGRSHYVALTGLKLKSSACLDKACHYTYILKRSLG